LARAGRLVIVADIDSDPARRVAASICSEGGRAESVTVDVADAKQLKELVDQTSARNGRLDYFFNNAAIGLVSCVILLQNIGSTSWM
jgi:NAD(P)-dependent dehydrogenase (short-subunit alcohol dehydrogenase family)